MQRFIMGWAVTLIAALAPALALAAGPGVAQQIANALRDSGKLKDYNINVKYQGGTAWLQGQVTSPQQMGQALAIAKGVGGVERVINEMSVNSSSSRPQTVKPADVSQPLTVKPAEQAPRPFQLASGPKSLSIEQEAAPTLAPPAAPEPASEPIINAPVIGRVVGGEAPEDQASSTPSRPIATRNRVTSAMQPAELGDASGGVVPAVPQFGRGAQPAPLNRAAMDQQVAQQIAHEFRMGGKLKGYRIGVTVQDGTARLNGTVASKQQMAQAVFIAKQTRGVSNVVNELSIGQAAQGGPVQKAGYNAATESMGAYNEYADAGAMGGAPMPAYGYGPAGAAPAHYDEPYMPNHAWPSYAAYPNYGAVTYPRQYSPTAWPYIGPFYPYPQVPLGWRKVTLEWDDGWWFLDFDDCNW